MNRFNRDDTSEEEYEIPINDKIRIIRRPR